MRRYELCSVVCICLENDARDYIVFGRHVWLRTEWVIEKKFRIDAQLYLRRSGPAAASSLCVCQSGTWRHTQHGTGRHGSAGYLSSSATNTDKVQTPSALSALFPGAYRLGTYTCKKGRKSGWTPHWRRYTAHYAGYTHVIDVLAHTEKKTKKKNSNTGRH